MNAIAKELDCLFELQQKIAEVNAKIAEQSAELVALRTKLEAEAKCKENLIKSKAKHVADPHTLTGKHLQLVWKNAVTSTQLDSNLAVVRMLLAGIPQAEIDTMFVTKTTKVAHWAITKRGV